MNRLQTALYLGRNIFESRFQRPHSSLLICSDSAGWSLDEDALALSKIANSLRVPARIGQPFYRKNGCVHYTSQFVLESPDIYFSGAGNRYAVDYYHGGPEDESFEELFIMLTKLRGRLTKVHVSNSNIEKALLSEGFSQDQVARIPIGVNIDWLPLQTEDSKKSIRKNLGISEDAFVIGSFQKDGEGWGEGLKPKLIKGPDLFVKVIDAIKGKVPSLHVLLTGPARGYVKNKLEEMGVSYTHRFLKYARETATYYQALDLYLLTSRVEGGPKAILESMASGVPLVMTRVGQAVDLARHGQNCWMVNSGDIEGLADGAMRAYSGHDYFASMRAEARRTAEAEDYLAQAPRWRELYFKNYVEMARLGHDRDRDG